MPLVSGAMKDENPHFCHYPSWERKSAMTEERLYLEIMRSQFNPPPVEWIPARRPE
jgi:hypothetical protein